MRTIWSKWTWAWWPPLSYSSLVLSAHLTVPGSIWSEWTRFGQFPWLAVKLPLSASLGQFTYIIYCASIVYIVFRLDSIFISLFSKSLQFKCLFQLTFSSTVLFDHCSNYCSVFWSWKCIQGISIPLSTTIYWVNKHHTRTGLTYFRLSIGLLKAYCHQRG
jgi:hypothetical protein